MNDKYPSSNFKKLLDKLQQESWQLELIISGFAIYGLFQGSDFLEIEIMKSVKNSNEFYSLILITLHGVMEILMMTLIIHVIVRGLWIGTLGLRYISGDIDYKGLGYTKKFTSFLQIKVGPFDRYIERLENICSTLFALAFLMVFYFISFITVCIVLGLLIHFFKAIDHPESIFKYIITTLYTLCAFIVFIDYLGGGFLKKYKFSSKIYFPIYKLFGYITLSFLYRPLVYNFLDQKKAKWVAILILPTYIFFGTLSSIFGKVNSNYQVEAEESTEINTVKYNYEDLMTEKTDMLQFVSIPSKVIEKSYLPIFIGFNEFMEDVVFEKDSTLKPKKDKRGYSFKSGHQGSGIVNISINESDNSFLKKQKRYLKIMSQMYLLKIDTLDVKSELTMTNHKQGRFGFETYLDIGNLKKGKHLLRLIGPNNKDSLNKKDTLITIPFWYFPSEVPVKSSTSEIIKDSISH